MDNSTNTALLFVAALLITIFSFVIGVMVIIAIMGGLTSSIVTSVGESSQETEILLSEKAAVIATLTAIPPRLVDFSRANPERGEVLFNTYQSRAGFACVTCHRVDSEDRLIGPGLLNIGFRAAIRVDGINAADYLRESIINPSAYLVEGFPDNLMPRNWGEIYSESETNHIIAYLLTLEGETMASVSRGIEVQQAPEVVALSDEEIMGGDPTHGESLFNTFQPEAGFACATCHRHNSEDRLIGPGLLNIPNRAETRVDGQSGMQYMYTSITSPDAFLVDGFPDDLMPENWSEIYSVDEIRDIIAYLMTLQ